MNTSLVMVVVMVGSGGSVGSGGGWIFCCVRQKSKSSKKTQPIASPLPPPPLNTHPKATTSTPMYMYITYPISSASVTYVHCKNFHSLDIMHVHVSDRKKKKKYRNG